MTTATITAEAQIRQMNDEFSAGVRARDLGRMLARYAKDAVIFDVTPAKLSIGLEHYRKHWQDFFDMLSGPIDHQTRDVVVSADGDLAVAHLLSHTSATQRDGAPLELWLRVSLAFRKVGGKWLVTHEHSSVPFDPQSMKAAVDLKPEGPLGNN
jgi:uncharacterized protein (TIGR02246 family)